MPRPIQQYALLVHLYFSDDFEEERETYEIICISPDYSVCQEELQNLKNGNIVALKNFFMDLEDEDFYFDACIIPFLPNWNEINIQFSAIRYRKLVNKGKNFSKQIYMLPSTLYTYPLPVDITSPVAISIAQNNLLEFSKTEGKEMQFIDIVPIEGRIAFGLSLRIESERQIKEYREREKQNK